jgi:hypothetical protein
MELLVGGSIVSLTLPVLDVFQRHWWPRHQQQVVARASAGARVVAAAASPLPPPNAAMPVTFRLSGLDGEATEPLVKELSGGSAGAAGQQDEDDRPLAGCLAANQGAGLALLLQLLLLAHQQPVRALSQVTGQLLSLLKAAVRRRDCRPVLLGQGGLGCLLHLVHLACKPLLDASAAAKQQQQALSGGEHSSSGRTGSGSHGAALGCGITAAQLLLLLECLEELVTEANQAGTPVVLGSTAAAHAQPSQQHGSVAAASSSSSGSSGPLAAPPRASSSSAEVAQLADGLSVLESAGLGSCATVLARVLTALAKHSSTAQQGLITHFARALDLEGLDAAAAAPGATQAAAAAADADIASDGGSSSNGGGSSSTGDAADAASGSAGGADEVPVLALVHAEAGGALSSAEHRLQLKGFLRLIQSLSSSSSSDKGAAASQQQQPEGLGQPGGAADFKQLVLQQGVPPRLAAYLVACFTHDERQLLQPGSAGWSGAAGRPGVPYALQLLSALAAGHAPTAAVVVSAEPLLLQLLHLLEGTAGGSGLTPLAEACLEALAGAGADGVADDIAVLRAATAAEMRAKAAKKRASLLASLGMVQVQGSAASGGGLRILPSPGGVPALSPLAAELAALEGGAVEEDEAGGVCMVCREGYGLQPSSLLGCYCFTRVAPAAEWPGCAPPWGTPHDLLFTTVSHFNLIHIACHAAAKAADATLRPRPKREWEGATLRNGQVLCNCIVPLAAPAAGKADTAYAAAVAAFWQQLVAAPSSREAAAAAGTNGSGGGGSGGGTGLFGGSGGGGASSGGGAPVPAVSVSLSRRTAALRDADASLLRVSLAAADLATLLVRFAARLSFNEEARGGGRASNARLVFALLQLGRFYVQEAPASELRQAQQLLTAATGTAAALELEAPSSSSSTSSKEQLAQAARHAPFVLALSLLLMGPSEWMAARRALLAAAARHGIHAAAAAPASSVASASPSSSPAPASSSGSSNGTAPGVMSDEALFAAAAPMLRLFGLVDWLHQWAKPAVGAGPGGWGAAMAAQLLDLRGCGEAANELLEALGEAEGAVDLNDLVDTLGLLGVVLGGAGAAPSCGAFLRQAARAY